MTNTTRFILPVLAAVLVLGGVAALAWTGIRGRARPENEAEPTSEPLQNPTSQPRVPTVDTAASSQIETATFALG